MAQDVIRRIREVTDKPIRYVVLSHYHAVRVLGASGYGAEHVIASRDTYDLIVERGEQDMKSEIERFPRLFRAVESVPGLTWPTIVFEKRLTLWLGKLQVEIMQLGRGHTKGDTVVWLPRGEDPVLRRPRRVRRDALHRRRVSRRLAGDARRDRGAAAARSSCRAAARRCMTPDAGARRASTARARSSPRCSQSVKRGVARRQGPAHRLPRDLRRAEAAVRPLGDLRPLPAVRRDARLRRGDAAIPIRASGPRERDKEMWQALEGLSDRGRAASR